MYIRRAEYRPETKPFIHLVCNNILPTSYLAYLPKKQALFIYMLMRGIEFDIPNLIYTTLRDVVFTTKTTKAIIFPHFISNLFKEAEVFKDHPFTIIPIFIYDHIRRAASPPPPQPFIDIDELKPDNQEAPYHKHPMFLQHLCI